MRRDVTLTGLLVTVLALVVVALVPAWGQGTDIEPNDTCPTAQDFGAVTLPFSVAGTLGTPSVDFFKFTAAPNSVIVIDHEGADSGKGTLEDPMVGLYDAGCTLLRTNDDSGNSLNSRLGFVVPADGVFIVAAAACCDSDFTGAQSIDGTYRLTLTAAGLITGTVTDGLGNPFTQQVLAFTPGGDLVASGTFPDGAVTPATYELYVPAGPHRVVAQGPLGRVWHHNRPAFLQADTIDVAIDQRVTGVDFTLPRAARVTPQLEKNTFVTGDTLVLALSVQNASPAAVNVRVIGTALVPGEPGINPESFCCFQDAVTLFEDPSVAIPALTSTTLPNVLSYQFKGSEPPGAYSVCVSQAQGRFIAQPCAGFTFTP